MSVISEQSMFRNNHNEAYLKKMADKHPFHALETAVANARRKLDKLKDTENVINTLSEEERRMSYLQSENKQLREELKSMN